MRRGLFLTGTGTGVGKTWVGRGLARACRNRGAPIPAIKPLETGCDPDPRDALDLERACGMPGLARAPGLYRARLPVAPYAATLAGEAPPPAPVALAASVRELAGAERRAIVEGAGGWLVPIDATHDLASLQSALGLSAVLVAPDRLGVLSDVLALHALARARALPLAAVVLVRQPADDADPSREHNARILAERLDGVPVVGFPATPDDDDALAEAAARHLPGLLDALR